MDNEEDNGVGKKENSLDEMLYFNRFDEWSEKDFLQEQRESYPEGEDLEGIIGFSSDTPEMNEDYQKFLQDLSNDDELLEFYDKLGDYAKYMAENHETRSLLLSLEQSISDDEIPVLKEEESVRDDFDKENSYGKVDEGYENESELNGGSDVRNGDVVYGLTKEQKQKEINDLKKYRELLKKAEKSNEYKKSQDSGKKLVMSSNSVKVYNMPKGIDGISVLEMKHYQQIYNKLSEENLDKLRFSRCHPEIAMGLTKKLGILKEIGIEEIPYRGKMTNINLIPEDARAATSVGKYFRGLYRLAFGYRTAKCYNALNVLSTE
ncbi:MAG: hypothetical protein OQK82_06270 [Candidatus Pacearchaeota archaeon]|nr:hypothetical protein [Candidatus Pacearchaeota archaeon]